MNEEQKIKEVQRHIDELSSELQNYQQKLFALQAELNRLHNKKITVTSSVAQTTSQNSGLENFIGLRIIHLVGIVVLVIGLSIGG